MEMRSKDYVQNLKKRDALLLEMEEENRAFGKTVPADYDAVFRMKRFIYWSDRTTAIETEIEIVDSCLTILKRKIRRAAMDLLQSDDPALSNYRAAHREKATLPIKHEADGDDDNNHGGIITKREIRKLEEEINGKIDAKVALVKEAAITSSDQHRLQESLIIQFNNVTVELDQLCADLRSKRPAAALILPGGGGSGSSQLSAGVVESEDAANDHTTPDPGYSIYSHNVCVELDQLCAELRSKRSAAAALNNFPGGSGSGSQQYSAGVVKSGDADDDTTPGLGSLASKKRKPKDAAVNRDGVRRSPRLAKPPLAKCCFC